MKNDSKTTLELFFAKKMLQKTPNIRRIASFRKSLKLATTHGLWPLQNAQFGSKIKIRKNM